jgi:hypothetical protein
MTRGATQFCLSGAATLPVPGEKVMKNMAGFEHKMAIEFSAKSA